MSRPSKCVDCGKILKSESEYKVITNKKYCLGCAEKKEEEKLKKVEERLRKKEEKKKKEKELRDKKRREDIQKGIEPISEFEDKEKAKESGYYNCACGCKQAYVIRGKELRFLRDVYNPNCWVKMDKERKAKQYILNQAYEYMMNNGYTDAQFYAKETNAFMLLKVQINSLKKTNGMEWEDIAHSLDYFFKYNNNKGLTIENFSYCVRVGYIYLTEENERKRILRENLNNNFDSIEKYMDERKDVIIDVEGIRNAERLESYRRKIARTEGHCLSDFVSEDSKDEETDIDEDIWE